MMRATHGCEFCRRVPDFCEHGHVWHSGEIAEVRLVGKGLGFLVWLLSGSCVVEATDCVVIVNFRDLVLHDLDSLGEAFVLSQCGG